MKHPPEGELSALQRRILTADSADRQRLRAQVLWILGVFLACGPFLLLARLPIRSDPRGASLLLLLLLGLFQSVATSAFTARQAVQLFRACSRLSASGLPEEVLASPYPAGAWLRLMLRVYLAPALLFALAAAVYSVLLAWGLSRIAPVPQPEALVRFLGLYGLSGLAALAGAVWTAAMAVHEGLSSPSREGARWVVPVLLLAPAGGLAPYLYGLLQAAGRRGTLSRSDLFELLAREAAGCQALLLMAGLAWSCLWAWLAVRTATRRWHGGAGDGG